MRQRQPWCHLAFIACLVAVLLLWATPGRTQNRDEAGTRLYTFGLYLFRHRDYYRAVTEFKRFALLFPEHPRQPAARLLIGLALEEDGLPDDAFGHFQRLRQDPHEDVRRVAIFKLGDVRFAQHHYGQAVEQFEQFLQTFSEGPLVPRATYLLGLSRALDGDFQRARDLLASLPPEHPFADRARALHQALPTAPLDETPSPRTAGILAGILPGAGHLYIGKPLQALTAFLLNGLFLTGAAFAFHEGLEATGAILLYFETGWYLGNINSAVQGARDIRRQRRQAFARRLHAAYAPAPLGLQHLQRPALGLRLSF